MRFPTTYRRSAYVTPKSPKARVAQKVNLWFKNGFPYISVIDEASDFKFGMHNVTKYRIKAML